MEEKISHKFTSEERLQIVSWVAEFKTRGEIQELVIEKFGKTIGLQMIYRYSHDEEWKPYIQKFREKYASEMFLVELANERRRIEELQDNYWALKKSGKLRDANAALGEIHSQLKRADTFIQNNYQLNVYKDLKDEDYDNRELELLQKRKKIKGEIDGQVTEVSAQVGASSNEAASG